MKAVYLTKILLCRSLGEAKLRISTENSTVSRSVDKRIDMKHAKPVKEITTFRNHGSIEERKAWSMWNFSSSLEVRNFNISYVACNDPSENYKQLGGGIQEVLEKMFNLPE